MPEEPNENAAKVVEIAASTEVPDAAREWLAKIGSKGGKKGGKARLKTLSDERRREIAYQAAKARWGAKKKR